MINPSIILIKYSMDHTGIDSSNKAMFIVALLNDYSYPYTCIGVFMVRLDDHFLWHCHTNNHHRHLK